MDYYKLIQVIRCKPELWDRCNSCFREPKFKEKVWEDVAKEMGETSISCKEGFKHLREKYIREREKSKVLKDAYKPWDMLPCLSFLDNQIIPRKNYPPYQFSHGPGPEQNQQHSVKSDNNCHSNYSSEENFVHTLKMNEENTINRINYSSNIIEQPHSSSQSDFDSKLVELVRQSRALWDWRNDNFSPDFSNKQTRNEIWATIGQKLNKTSSECLLRWKALREKYIREKMKTSDNRSKWKLLDSMTFLDKVIQYRRSSNRNSFEKFNAESNYQKEMNSTTQRVDSTFSSVTGDFLFAGESSTSNADYHYQVIGEENNSLHEPLTDFFTEVKEEYKDVPDSSYDSEGSSRKRRRSINSFSSVEKEREEKSPEQLFGELVASLLTRKSESDRHLAMVEIMKVLAK